MKKYVFLFIVLFIIIIFLSFLCIVGYLEVFNITYIDNFRPFKEGYNSDFTDIGLKELPTIDAAVAFYPLSSKIVENIYSKEKYNNELSYVSTQDAYKNIISGNVDIIIATKPSDEQLEEIKLSGKNLKFIPFAREALVFYVNKSNSISSLSVEEIGMMYNGDIESWEKIGGKNNEIITFQLMKNNGSQTSFEDIVKNNNINEKHMEANDMISIIQKVIHSKNGIGYAFNSFYTQQFNSSMLKLIEINGVKPSNYNIISGIYPLMHDIYFVYDENNSNESIKILENWVLSENCQSLCESLGFQRIN